MQGAHLNATRAEQTLHVPEVPKFPSNIPQCARELRTAITVRTLGRLFSTTILLRHDQLCECTTTNDGPHHANNFPSWWVTTEAMSPTQTRQLRTWW